MLTILENGDCFVGHGRLYKGGKSQSSRTDITNTTTETYNDSFNTNIVETTTINEASLTGEDLTSLLALVEQGTVSITSLGDGVLELQRDAVNSIGDTQSQFTDGLFNFAEDFGQSFLEFNTRAMDNNANVLNNALAAASGRPVQAISEPQRSNILVYADIAAVGLGVVNLIKD